MNKKVLVTGADGFIGSHLVEKLVKKGYEVKAFCFYNIHGSWGWLDKISSDVKKNIQIELGDIRDYSCMFNAIKGCDLVFHLAALISIPYSYKAPFSYVETNVNGTLNILDASKNLDVNRVIQTSTSEVYGSAQYVPIDEKHPISAQSPYAASKIASDQLALSYFRSFQLPISVIRPFNTYGPRQSNRAVIPTIITQILSNKKQIKLGLLTPTRDFNYVDDTCEAFISVAESDKCIGKVINSSSNFEISIKDTVQMISKIMNPNFKIISDEERVRPKSSEVNRLFGDNSLIKSLTNWEPKYSGIDGFEEGIKLTIDWFTNKDNLSLYNSNRLSL